MNLTCSFTALMNSLYIPSTVINSEWDPICLMVPPSKTTIRSANLSEEALCEIMIVVLLDDTFFRF